jgi:hypothetical protein
MTTSCVPGFDQLTQWSGQACALWSGRTREEKRQWVHNFFRAYGLFANDASVGSLIAQMDAHCGGASAPAGSVGDALYGYDWEGQPMQSQQQRDSDEVRVLTNPDFNRTLQTGLHEISNTVVGAFNSSNRTPYGYAPNSLGIGGYPTGYQPQGIYGGFNSPFGYGFGQINWTPILIGGVIVVGLGVFLVTMSKSNSRS